MTRILAIEAATEACSAALLIDDTVQERFEVAPRRHMALMLPFVESLLADADTSLAQLDAVAFSCGPGSFTGVRIGASMTQGIAFGADLPVIPVSTLATLAQGAVREHGATAVLAALDARMQEVYWGAFRCDANGLVEAVSKEQVCAPDTVECPQQDDWTGVGSGWDAYTEILTARCPVAAASVYTNQHPHAADVARLAAHAFAQGNALAPEQAIPVYLRNNVAHKPKPKVKT